MNYDRPISTIGYIGYFLLYSIPFIGIIALIMNAFSARNVNVRNYSRALFIVIILSYMLYFALIAMAVSLSSMPEYSTLFGFDFSKVIANLFSRIR